MGRVTNAQIEAQWPLEWNYNLKRTWVRQISCEERVFIITKLNEKKPLTLDKNCKSGVGWGGGRERGEEETGGGKGREGKGGEGVPGPFGF